LTDSSDGTAVLRIAAAASLTVAAFLVLASWDGLYDALDLPQPFPALAAQLGGLALAALAYVQWAGASRPEAQGIAATAGALAQGGGAVLLAAWLIFRDREDLGVDTLGWTILLATAVVTGVLALAQARLARAAR
jgi:hypothetical protein